MSRPAVIAFLFIFIHAGDALSMPPVSTASAAAGSAKSEPLKKIIEAYSAANRNIGIQATLIMPDGSAASAVTGYADIKGKHPLDMDCLMLTGSITKLYTAALVMEAVEMGRLSLDDTIERWVNASWASDVTIRELLNHTSGIPSYTSSPYYFASVFLHPKRSWTPGQILRYFIDGQLIFRPGSMYSYSNSNYIILGIILEMTFRERYGRILKERLCNRQGLGMTCFACPQGLPYANGYDRSLLHLGLTDMSRYRTSWQTSAFSAGGIASTSHDTAWFVHDLFTGRLLSPETMAAMMKFSEVKDDDYPSLTGYGLGIKRFIVGGDELFGHTGTIPGYSGIAVHNMKKGYTVCILGNLSVIDQEGLLKQVCEEIANQKTAP